MTHGDNFLESEVKARIEVIKSKSKRNKMAMRLFTITGLVLGALIALILGVDVGEEHQKTAKNSALILSACLTVVNGIVASTDYKSLWIRQKSTLLSLYQLQNEICYRKSKSTEFLSDDLFEKYLQIWELDGTEWKKIVIRQPTDKDRKQNG